MTMPLSSTRSRTSIRLEPAAVLSTAISALLALTAATLCRRRYALLLQRVQTGRDTVQLLMHGTELFPLLRFHRREIRIAAPPVHADLVRLVDRADEQADADGQQLHVREADADIASHDEALVQNPVEDVDQALRTLWPHFVVRRHLRSFLRCQSSFPSGPRSMLSSSPSRPNTSLISSSLSLKRSSERPSRSISSSVSAPPSILRTA